MYYISSKVLRVVEDRHLVLAGVLLMIIIWLSDLRVMNQVVLGM